MSALPRGLEDANLSRYLRWLREESGEAGRNRIADAIEEILAREPSPEDEELEAAIRTWRRGLLWIVDWANYWRAECAVDESAVVWLENARGHVQALADDLPETVAGMIQQHGSDAVATAVAAGIRDAMQKTKTTSAALAQLDKLAAGEQLASGPDRSLLLGTGGFCIVWPKEDMGPCVLCGSDTDIGAVGWHQQNPIGPVCDACMLDRERGLGALLKEARARGTGDVN